MRTTRFSAPVIFALFAHFVIACGDSSNADSPASNAGAGGAAAGSSAVAGSASAGAPSAGTGGAAAGAGQAGAASAGSGSGGVSAGAGGGASAGGAAGSGGAPGIPDTKVVIYLPNYSGKFADWATKIDFTKMTHLNLAFATATSSNGWSFGGTSDADAKVLIDAAHAKGVKVLISLGGAAQDISIINRYKDAANIQPLAQSLDAFVDRLNLDGVDVDVERGADMKASGNFDEFCDALIKIFRPKGKLVTTALAQYVVEAAGANDPTVKAWLKAFDFINVMIYNPNMGPYTSELNWWNQNQGIEKKKLVVGLGFFGGNEAYRTIMAADPNAWSKNSATVNGKTINYAGVARMKELTAMSKGWGGPMVWELSQDVTGEHSLWKAIQDTL